MSQSLNNRGLGDVLLIYWITKNIFPKNFGLSLGSKKNLIWLQNAVGWIKKIIALFQNRVDRTGLKKKKETSISFGNSLEEN